MHQTHDDIPIRSTWHRHAACARWVIKQRKQFLQLRCEDAVSFSELLCSVCQVSWRRRRDRTISTLHMPSGCAELHNYKFPACIRPIEVTEWLKIASSLYCATGFSAFSHFSSATTFWQVRVISRHWRFLCIAIYTHWILNILHIEYFSLFLLFSPQKFCPFHPWLFLAGFSTALMNLKSIVNIY